MDFKNEFPPIIEYNGRAISSAINWRKTELLVAATHHLAKQRRKAIVERFRFLTDNGIHSASLTQQDINIAFDLLEVFRRKHNLKRNFRNSWNDMLILATAINVAGDLLTEDNELARFAAEVYGAGTNHVGQFIQLRFGRTDEAPREVRRESKGYINAGWRVRSHELYKTTLL